MSCHEKFLVEYKRKYVFKMSNLSISTHLTPDTPDHKRPYSTTHTVTHKFFLVICHTLSRTISCLHSGIPCQTHHSTQVLTCHRLGCDLDVTRLPGIVLSQRGSSLQDALKILLSDTLAKSGLLRRRIGCLLLLTILSVYLHGFSSLYL